MNTRAYFLHLSVPAAFSAAVFAYALFKESFNPEILAAQLIMGLLFYVAPYLLWAVIVAIIEPSNVVAHSGFVACSLALALIASFWLLPPDPSGLPMQWVLYWPLAAILQVVIPIGTSFYVRHFAPNTALKRDRANRAAP